MNNLKATYRVQLHKDFNFEQLTEIIDYLRRLGIGALYASPVFEAMPGSTHGYDVFNPNRINPEIGTLDELRSISSALKKDGIQWLQDIVPNHVAYDTRDSWICDVLCNGPASRYAPFFDIDWKNEEAGNRVLVPFLGSTAEEAIAKGELTAGLHEGRLVLQKDGAWWPLRRTSYGDICTSAPATLQAALDALSGEEPDWHSWFDAADTHAAYLRERILEINADKEKLTRLHEDQYYRLCRSSETDEHINYRRFFIVNSLICLNIQDDEVLKEHHRLLFQLLDEGIFQGLRMDHIDGLADPANYLRRVRERAGDATAIVVEKILEPGENLPGWVVQGTTGYDFLSFVNKLLTNPAGEPALTDFYRQVAIDRQPYDEQVAAKKNKVLAEHMQGELHNLFRLFRSLDLMEENPDPPKEEEMREAIGALLVYCPVYRFYGQAFPLEEEEALAVQHTIDRARAGRPHLQKALSVLEEVLLQRPNREGEDYCNRVARFYSRSMQFSGPLMAKGVEDTLLYTYNRFIAHNEVGESPGTFSLSISDFHRVLMLRRLRWPLALNATSTHDTKRGEDVRARLQVLADLSEEWVETVKHWQSLNAALKTNGHPHTNDEYFIYQTLIGAWPMPGTEDADLPHRLKDYLQKSLREAKAITDWDQPDENYEAATQRFLSALLEPGTPFQQSFQAFIHRIADHGILNALVQVLLKFTCPGIPDVYQGCELWDLSLVDPDNRRPVDYNSRQRLAEKSADATIASLWNTRYDGGIKLRLVQQLFHLRRKFPALFSEGSYLPLEVEGKHKEHVIAFARQLGQDIFVVAAALHTASLANDPLAIDWEDTAIAWPQDGISTWDRLLSPGNEIQGKGIQVAHLFTDLPFALLQGHRRKGNERSAGVLLPLFSLPSAYGIGDMGPEAKEFARFLHRSGQRYWQLLPLNPIERVQGYSPYSSISSLAGNTIFISPELLLRDGWVDKQDLFDLPNDGRVDYEEAARLRSFLLEKAWQRWCTACSEKNAQDFEAFKLKEQEWLDDYALYAVLRDRHEGKPWYEWEDELRQRQPERMAQERKANKEAIEYIRWTQYIFSCQWNELKLEANALGLQFIGDLPFYVSHDAADVWTHPHLFALDSRGCVTGMAGVPPDAFSADGQLWGMPVFNWEAMKEENYSWWISRLRRNIDLFDLVRLDHFRAFASYWEVPAGAASAKEGVWKHGPGAAFFESVRHALNGLPFVAEDLGEIDEAVYELRDAFGLPGMKVLQFAFDGDSAHSPHSPHNFTPNFFVYTGTHDNNTTRGWFAEAGDAMRMEVEAYAGRPLSTAEISLVLGRMAYGSVARTAILPFQDVLNLDARTRINTPASPAGNWAWRLLPGQANTLAGALLRKWTNLYRRE